MQNANCGGLWIIFCKITKIKLQNCDAGKHFQPNNQKEFALIQRWPGPCIFPPFILIYDVTNWILTNCHQFFIFHFVPYKLKNEKCQNSIVQLPDKMKTWTIDLIFGLVKRFHRMSGGKTQKGHFRDAQSLPRGPAPNLCGRDHGRGTVRWPADARWLGLLQIRARLSTLVFTD